MWSEKIFHISKSELAMLWTLFHRAFSVTHLSAQFINQFSQNNGFRNSQCIYDINMKTATSGFSSIVANEKEMFFTYRSIENMFSIVLRITAVNFIWTQAIGSSLPPLAHLKYIYGGSSVLNGCIVAFTAPHWQPFGTAASKDGDIGGPLA